MKTPLERFLKYVSIDTQSKPGCEVIPSTPGQFVLGKLLAEELSTMGLEKVELTEHCHLYATLPANRPGLEAVGFIAHLDTSPAISGKNIKARVVENFDGSDIVLNQETGCTLRMEEYPEILRYKGQRLVVTDGTTLLGADDKAGITEIMGMLEYYAEHPELPHGDIQIAFTPDEEIGRGTDHFDVERFGAKLAYTVDGADLGKLSYENFNGAEATITVSGVGIHPGRGKNKMKNAALVAVEFQNMLPAAERPAHTEGYEGFYHLTEMRGDVESALLTYRVCDFNPEGFKKRKQRMLDIAEYLNKVYGSMTVSVKLTDTAYNMREVVEPHYYMIEHAKEAMQAVGVEPVTMPTRGGTDGVRLSFMGLPCPNLNTGSHNCHGRFECIPVESIEKITEFLIELVQVYARKK
ncbi:MAG: peptidase T [Angelakisella sp.]|nr:peptidase T [Angelakisella sp.]